MIVSVSGFGKGDPSGSQSESDALDESGVSIGWQMATWQMQTGGVRLRS